MGKVPIHLYDSLEYEEIELVIGSRPKCERLDSHVVGRYGYFSRSYIQKLIRQGCITVNGREVRPSRKVQAGDRLNLRLPVVPERVIEPEPIGLDVIYEDEAILVINKPPNITCHAGKRYHGGTLANAIIHYRFGDVEGAGKNNPGIVHRLDKNTSGVMVLAKDLEAHRRLAAQFSSAHPEKEYLALVKGTLKRARGTIDAPIGKHPRLRNTMSVRLDATDRKSSVTHYSLKERFAQSGLVSLVPKTGRTHQLRVHMEALGHPLIGEDRYRGFFARSSYDRAMGRQALHAWRLRICHPVSGQSMLFEAELPKDVVRLIGLLREDSPDTCPRPEKHHHH